MSDLNKSILVGRLTRDAELKYTQSGTAVLSFSIANGKTWKQDGEKKEQVSFFNCVIWGKFGESIADYMKKGLRIGIEGRLQQDTWEDQDGKKRQAVKVIVDNLQFLSSGENKNNNSGASEPPAPNERVDDNPFSDEDIPF